MSCLVFMNFYRWQLFVVCELIVLNFLFLFKKKKIIKADLFYFKNGFITAKYYTYALNH